MRTALEPEVAGSAFQSCPRNMRPAFFLRTPPHCLKKNGTPNSAHWSRICLDPGGLDRACSWTALAADDNPLDAVQWESRKWREQRLTRQEPYAGLNSLEMPDPRIVDWSLHADAHPYVVGDSHGAKEALHPLRALRQNLELVP